MELWNEVNEWGNKYDVRLCEREETHDAYLNEPPPNICSITAAMEMHMNCEKFCLNKYIIKAFGWKFDNCFALQLDTWHTTVRMNAAASRTSWGRDEEDSRNERLSLCQAWSLSNFSLNVKSASCPQRTHGRHVWSSINDPPTPQQK